MKKYFNLVLILVIALFIGIGSARAEQTIAIDHTNNYNCVTSGSVITCNIKFIVTDGPMAYNRVKINYTLTNATVNTTSTVARTGWHIIETTNSYIILENESGSITNNAQPVTIVYNVYGSPCRVSFNAIQPYTQPYYCTKKYNKYYDIGGNIVTYNEYLYSCFYCANKGEKDNNYHGTTGAVVSEAEYYQQCDSVYCKVAKDSNNNNVYFGPSGTVITQTEYAVQCENKKLCVEENNKYYDKDGNETDKLTFYRTCKKNYCKKITSGSTTIYFGADGTELANEFEYKKQCEKPQCGVLTSGSTKVYYDKNKNEVTEAQYKKSCFACSKKGNKYYDNDGNEVSKYNYQLACESLKCNVLTTDDNKEEYYDKNGTKTTKNEYLKQCQINICTIIDGTYFDLSGKQVSETEYKKSCYSCAKENNKYYDKDGKEITESEWKATCEKPKCVEKDGKYYDNNGNEVSKKEFENKCPKNVQTGDNITLKMYLYIGLGLAITIGIMYFSKKHTKISKI